MSRRVAPILKDVIPPWTLGPVTRSAQYKARLAARQRGDRAPGVRLDPASPPEFGRTCVPCAASPQSAVHSPGNGDGHRPLQAGQVRLPIPEPGTRRHTSWVNQQGRCYYCWHLTPLERWTLDHKIARAKGGRNHFSNLIGACWTCNHAKRTLSSEDFLATEYVRRRRLDSGVPALNNQQLRRG